MMKTAMIRLYQQRMQGAIDGEPNGERSDLSRSKSYARLTSSVVRPSLWIIPKIELGVAPTG